MCEDLSISTSWDQYSVNFTHCQETNPLMNSPPSNVINHFMWNENLKPIISDAGVLHSAENRSDHKAIFTTLRIQTKVTQDKSKKKSSMKTSWKKTSNKGKQNFQRSLESSFNRLEIPTSLISCRNFHCKDLTHLDDIDKFTIKILKTVEQVAVRILRVVKFSGKESKQARPGWFSMTKPQRGTALFWYKVWLSADRPQNTELHRIMKKTRNAYHLSLIHI